MISASVFTAYWRSVPSIASNCGPRRTLPRSSGHFDGSRSSEDFGIGDRVFGLIRARDARQDVALGESSGTA